MRRLLGLGAEAGSRIEQSRLYFAGGLPRVVAAALLLVAALWFGYLYLKDGTRPSLWVKVPLLGLRLCAIAALLVMLLQPMLRMEKSERLRSQVLVLVDRSASMGFRDPRLGPDRTARAARVTGPDPRTLTRGQIAEQVVTGPTQSLLGELAKRFDVRLYLFSSDAQTASLPASVQQRAAFRLNLKPDERIGASTQIGTALGRALDDVAGQPVAGALLVSDGGNNAGDDPVGVAVRARQSGVPVSTLGIGDPTPTRDLAVTEVLADQVARANATIQVFAGIAHRGYGGRPVTVTLRRGGEIIGTQTLRLGPAGQKQTATFTYTPKQVGTFAYTVGASRLGGENTHANNQKSFAQQVVGKKLRILYVDGEPRWEFRYLRNAILRDTQIAFSCYLVATGAQNGGEGNIPIDGFPRDEKTLFDYDIVILGDVPRAHFSDMQLRSLRRFVEDKGSSLIVIAGEKHMPHAYRNTPLEAVLPVVLPVQPEQVQTDEPFRWELTPQGQQDPLLRLSDDSGESEQIWRALPGMYWNAGVERAKPGATILAVNPARSNAYGKRIVLAVQPFGEGRCLLCLSDSTWQWRWRVGDRYFYRYWGQAIRAMTPSEPPGGNRFAQVNADRGEYALGERVAVNARLLDAFYRPIKAGSVVATLRGPTGGPTSVTLLAVPGSPGLFAGDILAERVGRFNVSLASPASPQTRATATFMVQNLALERQQPEMNEALLKQIARAGGGRYYQTDQARRWLQSLRPNDLRVRSESEIELWDAPLLLLLFIVPLALEWLIRKRSGLL